MEIFLSLSWWKALKRISNYLAIMWIPLESEQLNNFNNFFKNSFNEPCMDFNLY